MIRPREKVFRLFMPRWCCSLPSSIVSPQFHQSARITCPIHHAVILVAVVFSHLVFIRTSTACALRVYFYDVSMIYARIKWNFFRLSTFLTQHRGASLGIIIVKHKNASFMRPKYTSHEALHRRNVRLLGFRCFYDRWMSTTMWNKATQLHCIGVI